MGGGGDSRGEGESGGGKGEFALEAIRKKGPGSFHQGSPPFRGCSGGVGTQGSRGGG